MASFFCDLLILYPMGPGSMPSINENQDCVGYKLYGILYSLSGVIVWFLHYSHSS